MAGRKPDFDVLVAVPYVASDGNEKTNWHKVGCGWSSERGDSVLFNIVTSPNVRFVLKKKEQEEVQ
jgi:hypothetical protein